MRWIYISPHLDDAVLSAGGLIYDQVQAGIPVEVWTITSGYPPTADLSPFARAAHTLWGVPSAVDVINTRRAEDSQALTLLGARYLHFDFLDCIYRRAPGGDWLYQEIFIPPHPTEADLPARIADALSAHLLPDDQLVCQFAIGSHVDHVLVRRAAELLNRPLHYLADQPYLFKSPVELQRHTAGLTPEPYPVSQSGFNAWLQACQAYATQLDGLFESPAQMRALYQQYWETSHGLQLWRMPL